jgi:hypothetical protein
MTKSKEQSALPYVFVVSEPHSRTSYRTYIKLVNSSLLEVIYEVIARTEPEMGALDGLSPAFWKLLVRSFLKFMYVILNLMLLGAHTKLTPKSSKHNHFHIIFFKFFFAVVDRKHERTLRVFVRKTSLITSMIDLYENRDSQICKSLSGHK